MIYLCFKTKGFGETWTGDENVVSEDWNDDSWQGEVSSLTEFLNRCQTQATH